MELKKAKILITGASSGIGKAAAIALAREGAIIAFTYNQNKSGADITSQEVSRYSKPYISQLDLGDIPRITTFVEELISNFGIPDVLINNAAITEDFGPFMDETSEQINRVINVDLTGIIILTRLFLKHMKSGKIINISSIKAEVGGNRTVAYAAAKAGLDNFSKTLTKIVSPSIQVFNLNLGPVKTERYVSFPKEVLDKMQAELLNGKWVLPEDVVDILLKTLKY